MCTIKCTVLNTKYNFDEKLHNFLLKNGVSLTCIRLQMPGCHVFIVEAMMATAFVHRAKSFSSISNYGFEIPSAFIRRCCFFLYFSFAFVLDGIEFCSLMTSMIMLDIHNTIILRVKSEKLTYFWLYATHNNDNPFWLFTISDRNDNFLRFKISLAFSLDIELVRNR